MLDSLKCTVIEKKKNLMFAKSIISILLVLIIGVNSYAAVVSDNDGAAFISKAEFDSLRTNFQSKINEFNTSIDNKIEAAISSYLKGMKASKETKQDNLYNRFATTVKWSSVPIQTTSLKYRVKSFSALFFQGDGYSSSNQLLCRFMSGSKDTTSSGTGLYNLFQKDSNTNVKYYYGYVSGEYCTTNYTLSGVFMFSGTSISGITYPSGAVNASRASYPDSTSYEWNGGGGSHHWYTSTPNTSGWGAKKSYWSRSDSYNNGTVYKCIDYMSSGSVSTSSYRMIDFNNRVGGYSETGANTNYRSYITPSYTLSTAIMYNGGAGGSPTISDDHAYFYPQTYDLKVSDLYSWAAYLALNRNIYLYQGLPLFKSTGKGKAKCSFTLYTSDSSAANVTFYLRDNSFFANGTPSGNQNFNVWRVASDGTKTLIGNNVTYISVSRSTKIEIEFDVQKDHEYIFKLAPSNTSYYAYVSGFSDIIVTEDV